MDPVSRKVKGYQKKRHISQLDASRRAKKGWETRRQNNPHLRNIEYVSGKDYKWKRPNGESVPLKNFSHDQVELMAPGLSATDRHLKKQQKLTSQIRGSKMVMHNMMGGGMGGYAVATATIDPKDVGAVGRAILKPTLHIPRDSWGKYNVVVMNKRALDHPHNEFHPTGIMTHEIGHLVGPGRATNFGPSYKHAGTTVKNVKDFEKGFQWEAPRFKDLGKDRFKLDRKGEINMDLVDYGHGELWRMKDTHPGAEGGYKKSHPDYGLASKINRRTYQNWNQYEDFAETYRNTVGIPINTNANPSKHSQEWWGWKDKGNSRKHYMEQYHLEKAASPNQYKHDLAEITTKNKRRASLTRARKVRARQAKINNIKRRIDFG